MRSAQIDGPNPIYFICRTGGDRSCLHLRTTDTNGIVCDRALTVVICASRFLKYVRNHQINDYLDEWLNSSGRWNANWILNMFTTALVLLCVCADQNKNEHSNTESVGSDQLLRHAYTQMSRAM